MFGLFKKDKTQGFGLDISESSVKVVQIVRQANELVVDAFAKVKLPEKVVTGHLITDAAKLSSLVGQAVSAARKISSRYVVVSIPEAKSFVRNIHLPKMQESDVAAAVPFEFEQNIPIPVDQVYFDWQIIGESADGFELLVTAAPRDYIDTLLEVLDGAKLKPLAFELESQASARALLGQEDFNQANLIIDISELQTNFLLVEKNNLQYTSSILIGGASFTEALARNLEVTIPEAEKIKIESGLLQSRKNANQAILPVLDNIIDEIRNVLKFYEVHYKNHLPLKQIVLCGGGSRVPGLSEYISVRLNLGSATHVSKVVDGDPFRHLSKLPGIKIDGPAFTTPIGLALHAADFKIDW